MALAKEEDITYFQVRTYELYKKAVKFGNKVIVTAQNGK